MWEQSETELRRADGELESTYAHLRAVIDNCRHSPVEAIRHQLVGLLPETRDLEPEVEQQMLAQGLDHLVERHKGLVRDAWAEFGYGSGPDDDQIDWSHDRLGG
jgi:hypothetical protein